ncbi:unnamed protein product [Adineta ricciae]|uniref:G-protein coupled receptors family 1 profile domain-containing protein n=1 Tax=Adineta ricciae TaxID=249248 RepID=A0A814I3I3_ADIRI|nr:unnamed protein product [Adineta ricciae]CAF1019960.1 unnamed protein product [Adineta ricciae]
MSLTFLTQQFYIYIGFFLIVTGVFGSLFNITVFLSLKTFRQNTSVFYLTIMSFVNIGQLLFGLFSRVLISGFAIDWSATSIVFCKLRLTLLNLCSLVSYTCLCLAIFDQYLATSTRPRWQQWSSLKTAYRLTLLFTFIWILHLIPYPIFLQHVTSRTTGKTVCSVINDAVSVYRNYYVTLVLVGYLPDIITVVFGVLAYNNIRQIAYRTLPLVRRELDKQLTVMVFAQVIVNLVTNTPCVTMIAITYSMGTIQDSSVLEITQFVSNATTIIFYSYFSSSFYIYICVSERFRRQFIYVISQMHPYRWQQQIKPNNQIVPT